MLDKQKSSVFVIAAYVVVLIAFVQAQGNRERRVADADPRYVETQQGATLKLMCRFGQPISTCRFVLPGEPVEIKLNPDWAPRNDNFKYFGAGLQQGQCGLEIASVRNEYHGNATCVLDPNDGLADAVGNIEIVIAEPPSPPEIELRNGEQLEAGNEIEALCKSIDGRPVANITWFLEDQLLGPGHVEVFDSQDRGNSYHTVVSTIRYILRPEDHTKNLICRVSHPGYQEGFLDTRTQLSVNFRPVPMSEIVISGLEIGSSAEIGPISILANPKPILKWTVDGTVINEGEQTDRFVANEPRQVGIALWNITLTVTQLTLQDTTMTYRLRASNPFGATDYQIRIGGSPGSSGTGLGIVPIIAISIISLFVLIVIVLVVVAKVTKRWCFAGDSMHPNGPDSEAQIAPEDDRSHEHYEQHEKVADEEIETGTGDADAPPKNGKAKGNTSV